MATADQMQRLKTVLDVYGADRDRWPVAERAALDALIAGSAEAQALVAAESAFDGLLARALHSVEAASAEQARTSLFAKLEAETDAGAPASNVIPLVRKAGTPVPAQPERRLWRELSVLAAALLIGFFTVSQGVLEGSSFDPARLTADASDDGDDVSDLALGTTDADLAEEGML